MPRLCLTIGNRVANTINVTHSQTSFLSGFKLASYRL